MSHYEKMVGVSGAGSGGSGFGSEVNFAVTKLQNGGDRQNRKLQGQLISM